MMNQTIIQTTTNLMIWNAPLQDSDYFGFFMLFFNFLGYVGELIRILNKKNYQSISLVYWIFHLLANSMVIAYSYVQLSCSLMISGSISSFFTIILIVIILTVNTEKHKKLLKNRENQGSPELTNDRLTEVLLS